MPSLFSASQLRSKTTIDGVADTAIVLVEDIPTAKLVDTFGPLGIQFIKLAQNRYWRNDGTFFNKTHVPVSSLARLAMQEVLPPQYEHIVYLDGDTYIAGDISPLVTYDVPPNKLAAVDNSSWLSSDLLGGSYWETHVKYCRDLGVSDPSQYFNSGVLAFKSETWRELAPEALKFFEQFPEKCRYHDQSALNAIFYRSRERLSPVWNYQTGYAQLGMPRSFSPKIWHFTGSNKPWLVSEYPWEGKILDEYRKFVQKYPFLAERYFFSPHRQANRVLGKGLAAETLKLTGRNLRNHWRRHKLKSYLTRTEFVA